MRYLVEGRIGPGTPFPPADVADVLERNVMGSVTWICTYVGRSVAWSLYDGPHPEAVRRAAGTSGLEVARVCEVHILDPHAYRDVTPSA